MITIYAAFLFSMAGVTSAVAQSANPCAAIIDDRSRLHCYDDAAARARALSRVIAAPVRPPVAAPVRAAPKESIIEKAETAVKQQLRDPHSAKFGDLETKIVAGKRVVCGGVSSTNAQGEMTGQVSFAFDGDNVAIMAWEGSTANGTIFDAKELAASLHNRLDEYNTYCQ